MDKKCKVVLLSTENNTKVSKGNITGVLDYHQFFSSREGIYSNHTYQHLYILSDDEAKKGDWVIFNNEIYKISKTGILYNDDCTLQTSNASIFLNPKYCKVIVATTNTDLLKEGVAKIEDKFIEEYCINPVESALVEYTGYYGENGLPAYDKIPKLSSNDSIIIKPDTITDKLKEYFKNTPREEVLRGWAEAKKNSAKNSPKVKDFIKAVELEETWDCIMEEFENYLEGTKYDNESQYIIFGQWLSKNYEIPKKK